MLSESDIEAAHPEAFDFVWGNLPTASRADFDRHLLGCRYCQAVVDEYADIGQIIQRLPPHVEPPTHLEDRTVAAMVAALAKQRAKADRRSEDEDQAATRAYPIPERRPPAEPKTQVQPIPQLQPPAEDEAQLRRLPADQPTPAETAARPMVTRLPVWRRHRGRLSAVVAVAAAIITAAILVPFSLGGGRTTPPQAIPVQEKVVIPLSGTTAGEAIGFGAATGQAIARQDTASGSWEITLTVAHLKHHDPAPWYECWYVSRTGQVASAGTFLVGPSGSRTFSMTSAADPHDFSKMEITLQSPTSNGALGGIVILSGRPL
jgi:Anti-sigma-K factor rskA, C-terminal